jgi:hypothetical protein
MFDKPHFVDNKYNIVVFGLGRLQWSTWSHPELGRIASHGLPYFSQLVFIRICLSKERAVLHVSCASTWWESLDEAKLRYTDYCGYWRLVYSSFSIILLVNVLKMVKECVSIGAVLLGERLLYSHKVAKDAGTSRPKNDMLITKIILPPKGFVHFHI